jgi:hypothetical protein
MAYVENCTFNNSNTRTLWMRRVQVILKSKKTNKNGNSNTIVFGDPVLEDDDAKLLTGTSIKLNKTEQNTIKITGSKYLATLKDNGVVEISNVEYDTIAMIMLEEMYDITIKVGYESTGTLETYFHGEVSYMSQKIHSHHDITLYLTYASRAVAAYSQKRINFTGTSSVNVYTMLQYLTSLVGDSATLSSSLKQQTVDHVITESGTFTDLITECTANLGETYQFSTDDSISGTVISCTTFTDKRFINLVNLGGTISIKNGNPTVTSSGLDITLLPIMNFVPGDIIQIDNGWIDLSSGMNNTDSVKSTFNTSYIDKDGQYMIYEIYYAFANRGSEFELHIKARALDYYKNLTGISIS